MINHKLILITHNYPYGQGETFLETEIQYLTEEFKEILIICKNDHDKDCRKVPENVTVKRFNPKSSFLRKFIFPFLILTRARQLFLDFKKELNVLKTIYALKINILRLNMLFHFMAKGLEFSYYLLKEINRENKSCILYSYWLDNSAYSLKLLSGEIHVNKIISRAHRGEIYFDSSKTEYQPMFKILCDGLDEIYFVSEHGKSYFKEKLGIKGDLGHLKISRLGVINEENRLLSTPLNENFLIVSCSNLITVKRIDLIIKALSLFQHEKIDWIHVGEGQEYNKLCEEAKKLLKGNANIKINFIGSLSNQEIFDFYEKNEVSLIVNVSASEGIPVSLMEAFSFGIPAIATNVGGTSELVNNSNGILLNSNPSAKELFKAIRKFYLLSDSEILVYRENAFRTWKKNYNSRNYKKFSTMLFSR